MDPSIEKKLALYSRLKNNFQTEPYLDLPSFRDRQIIYKFICSSHRLLIETGRHQNIPREERICQLCTMNKVEDEEHFIHQCPRYNQSRQDIIPYLQNYTNVEAVFYLVDPATLADFLREASSLREELMEEPPDIYRIKKKSNDGLKLLFCKDTRTTDCQKHKKGWVKT